MLANSVTYLPSSFLNAARLLLQISYGTWHAGDFALKHASWMVGSQYKPAEVAKMDWEAVKQGPPWAIDSWGLGCMMQEVFSGQPLTAVEQLRRTDVIPPALLADYQKLLSSQTGKRLNPAKVCGLPCALYSTHRVDQGTGL